jgi:hypothetical protein
MAGEPEIEVVLAWWVMPYAQTLAFVCALMGTEPDWDKLERVVMRGARVKVK